MSTALFITVKKKKKKGRKLPKCPLSDEQKTWSLPAVECYLAKQLATLHLPEHLRTLG